MKTDFKHIIKRSRDLLIDTGKTWDTIASENTSVKNIRMGYVFPWIAVCTLVVFSVNLLYASERKFEIAFLETFISCISLSAGYFITNYACFRLLVKKAENKSKEACETVIAYSFTTIFVLKIVTVIFPGLFFLQILVVHCAYLLWEGMRAVLQFDEKEQGNYLVFFALFLIFSPIVIVFLLSFMLPNA